MAYLNMPGEKTDVMRSDFIAWAEQYMRLDEFGASGADLYGTRCSILHGGAPSRFTREGRGRMLQHSAGAERSTPPVDRLVEAFFAGIERFLRDAAQEDRKAEIVNRRLEELAATGLYDVRDLHDGRKFAPSFSL